MHLRQVNLNICMFGTFSIHVLLTTTTTTISIGDATVNDGIINLTL